MQILKMKIEKIHLNISCSNPKNNDRQNFNNEREREKSQSYFVEQLNPTQHTPQKTEIFVMRL